MRRSKQWQLVRRRGWPSLHVIPKHDAQPHTLWSDCWCKPTESEPGLWVHHSADGRETGTTATRH